jgi:hypothetical protein
MLASEKIAIAAHLHVMLRRKTGRVTDTEWMAQNLEYAMEIVRFTRAKAVEDTLPELNEWADKLEAAVLERAPPHRPLAQSALESLKERKAAGAPVDHAAPPYQPAPSGFGHSVPADTGFADSVPDEGKAPKPREPGGSRYVGGIR